MKKRNQTMLELFAEVLLSILPMILVLLQLIHSAKSYDFFSRPEWAFGAAIFYGQTIVRLVVATGHNHQDLNVGFLAILVVLLILMGLGPSCSIVTLVLGGEETSQKPIFIQWMQVVLYVLSALAYVVLGVLARELEHAGTPGQPKTSSLSKLFISDGVG